MSAREVEIREVRADADPGRVAARVAIGPDAKLVVDANGAYSRTQALAVADRAERFRA